MDVVNLAEKLAGFREHYQPRTVAEFNGNDVMVVKLKGEFVWHKHDETDDFFLVLKGRLTIQLRERNVELGLASSSSCRAASSTAPWRTKKCTCCSSSPPAPPTPATARPRNRVAWSSLWREGDRILFLRKSEFLKRRVRAEAAFPSLGA
jgi:hypothetical protein